MKKILIILIPLLLCDNIAFGKSNYEIEDEAYNLHTEAIKESDYQKALIKYSTIISKYGDTEYYEQNREAIQAEIENIKEEMDYVSKKEEQEKILLERKKEEELTRKSKEQEEELKNQ